MAQSSRRLAATVLSSITRQRYDAAAGRCAADQAALPWRPCQELLRSLQLPGIGSMRALHRIPAANSNYCGVANKFSSCSTAACSTLVEGIGSRCISQAGLQHLQAQRQAHSRQTEAQTEQHSGKALDWQCHDADAARPVQDGSEERLPHAGAARQLPSDEPSGNWQYRGVNVRERLGEDAAARQLATRINQLVRARRSRDALELFNPDFKASPAGLAHLFDSAVHAHVQLGDIATARELMEEMRSRGIAVGYVAAGSMLSALCKSGQFQEALALLDEQVAAGTITPAMSRMVAVAAMQVGDLLAADAAIAADDARCDQRGQPRQRDTWAQVIRLQGMKGGPTQAEAAFTEAQQAVGPSPELHEAYLFALAKAGALPQALSAFEEYLDSLPPPPHLSGPLPAVFAADADTAAGGTASQRGVKASASSSTANVAPDSSSGVSTTVGPEVASHRACPTDDEGPEQLTATARQQNVQQQQQQQQRSTSDTSSAQRSPIVHRRQWPSQVAALQKVHGGVQQAAVDVVAAAEAAADVDTARSVIELLSQAGHVVPAVVWNAAIRAAVKGRADVTVLDDILEEMLFSGVPADMFTYSALAWGYTQADDLPRALGVLEHMLEAGVEAGTYIYNALIGGAAAAGDVELAQELYNGMADHEVAPDQVTYVELFRCIKIAAAAMRGKHATAADAQQQRETEAMFRPEFADQPSSVAGGDAAWQPPAGAVGEQAAVWRYSLSDLVSTEQPPQEGASQQTVSPLDVQHAEAKHHLRVALEELEGKLRQWAVDFYERKIPYSQAALVTQIQAYGAVHDVGKALRLLRRAANGKLPGLKEGPNELACEAALAACARIGDMKTADLIKSLMQHKGLPMRAPAWACMIWACSYVGDLRRALSLRDEMAELGLDPDLRVQNALMRTHCVVGDLPGAVQLLQDLPVDGLQPNRQTWNILLTAAKLAGAVDLASQVLAMMPEEEREYWEPRVTWMYRRKPRQAVVPPPMPLYDDDSDDDWGW